MRIFNILMIILSVLLFFTLGGLLLAVAFAGPASGLPMRAWQDVMLLLETAPARIVVGGAGALMLIFAAITVLGNLRDRRFERTVVFHNPHGEVMIALGALEDLGKVVKAEIPGLKDIKLHVSARRKGLQVTARASLWCDASLPKTTEMIQDSVRHYLQEIVGQEQEIRPRVVVSKVAFRSPEDYEASGGDLPSRRLRRPMV